MDYFGSILGAIGSIASLVSLIAFWRSESAWRLRIALIIIVILTASSSYLSYQYYAATRPEIVRQERQQALRKAAQTYIQTNSLTTSYWQPGVNEGIVKSGLAILEVYKEVIPETYASIKLDIEEDMNFGQQHRDKEEQRQALETAAKNMITLFKFKTLAGNG